MQSSNFPIQAIRNFPSPLKFFSQRGFIWILRSNKSIYHERRTNGWITDDQLRFQCLKLSYGKISINGAKKSVHCYESPIMIIILTFFWQYKIPLSFVINIHHHHHLSSSSWSSMEGDQVGQQCTDPLWSPILFLDLFSPLHPPPFTHFSFVMSTFPQLPHLLKITFQYSQSRWIHKKNQGKHVL